MSRKPDDRGLLRCWVLAAAALGAAILVPHGAAAYTEQVLYTFCPQGPTCADGRNPGAGLLMDAAANLYGTTYNGGASNQGVAFVLAPDGTETVLGNGGPYAAHPVAGLIMDGAGNLYGTTAAGGAGYCGGNGCGVVFELAADGTGTILYRFSGGADGGVPEGGGLLIDAAGNLYGTTAVGGNFNSACDPIGRGSICGVVFKLAPDGTETVLYSFCPSGNCTDGREPYAGLIMDAAGNLYGTTANGGTYNAGVVFQLAPDGTETVLYSFCTQIQQDACADGANPRAGLVMDAAGNLYGTTSFGGNTGCPNSDGCGVVFKLTADGTYTVLYSFCPQSGCADGKYPHAGLIMDAAGNLYGTTAGGDVVSPTFPYGDGVVFKLAPDGTYTVLYTFCSQGPPCADGSQPAAGLIIDAAGNLYGTTAYGGIVNPNDPLDSGSGVVFKLTP